MNTNTPSSDTEQLRQERDEVRRELSILRTMGDEHSAEPWVKYAQGRGWDCFATE